MPLRFRPKSAYILVLNERQSAVKRSITYIKIYERIDSRDKQKTAVSFAGPSFSVCSLDRVALKLFIKKIRKAIFSPDHNRKVFSLK